MFLGHFWFLIKWSGLIKITKLKCGLIKTLQLMNPLMCNPLKISIKNVSSIKLMTYLKREHKKVTKPKCFLIS